jgi:hypothetical protein
MSEERTWTEEIQTTGEELVAKARQTLEPRRNEK